MVEIDRCFIWPNAKDNVCKMINISCDEWRLLDTVKQDQILQTAEILSGADVITQMLNKYKARIAELKEYGKSNKG